MPNGYRAARRERPRADRTGPNPETGAISRDGRLDAERPLGRALGKTQD
ncbi:hypothetical protein [Amycolatopsis sp. NPDC001319]